MAEPVPFQTPRGTYRLNLIDEAQVGVGPWSMTLSVEHAGGLEKFAFQCHIAAELVERSGVADCDEACARLAPWLERQFEAVREAALKTIRSERRLVEIEFDHANPGPFA
jgi:hypothetical protein